MIPRIIHQVYGTFEDDVQIEDIPIFAQQVSKTKQFCKSHDIQYKMWDAYMCRELLQQYPVRWTTLYNNFREKIQRADFIRYLILYHEGGLYVDCDICPINCVDEILKNDIFFVKWNNDKKELPYNAVLGSVKGHVVYDNILTHLEDSYYQKIKNDIYETWKGRFVFQTTGHFMVNRVLKKHPYVKKLDILKVYGKGGEIISDVCPVFEDYNASIWYQK